jgi:hypothetical protein
VIRPITGVAEGIEVVYYRGMALPVLHGIIQEGTSGDNELVAGVADYEILVLAYNYMTNGAVNVKWRSGTTDISGLGYMDAASKGKVAPYNPKGWFTTAPGEALNLNLSASQPVGGEYTYVMVPV